MSRLPLLAIPTFVVPDRIERMIVETMHMHPRSHRVRDAKDATMDALAAVGVTFHDYHWLHQGQQWRVVFVDQFLVTGATDSKRPRTPAELPPLPEPQRAGPQASAAETR